MKTVDEYVACYQGRRPAMLRRYRQLDSNVPYLRDSKTRWQNWINFLRAMALVLEPVSVPVSRLRLDRKEDELDQETLFKLIEECKSGEYTSWHPLLVEGCRPPDLGPLKIVDGNHRAGAVKRVLPNISIEVVFAEIMLDFE